MAVYLHSASKSKVGYYHRSIVILTLTGRFSEGPLFRSLKFIVPKKGFIVPKVYFLDPKPKGHLSEMGVHCSEGSLFRKRGSVYKPNQVPRNYIAYRASPQNIHEAFSQC